MSQYPVQRRTVDPFATYNSDTVNKLTRMTTFGQNALETYSSLRCTIADATSRTIVILSPGVIYKDDVRIEMPSSTLINFEDPNFYVDFGPGFNEEGYYYILLEYRYEKSRPAPQAKITMLKPSQRSLFDFSSDWILLQVVRVDFNTPNFEIMALYDSDPDDPIKKRRYIKRFAGTETQLGPFSDGDQSRIVYDVKTDKFWFGYIDRWAEAGGAGGTEVSDINTSLVTVGEVCRIDSTGFAVATLADTFGNQADLVCTKVGTTDGKGITSGVVDEVLVQTGILIAIGDLLYLSSTEPGRVTNIRTTPTFQLVGRALTNASVTTPVKMIFDPDVMITESFEGQISSWVPSGTTPPYYHDIDIATLDTTGAVLCNFFDDSTLEQIVPAKILFFGSILRVFHNNDTDIFNYIISGGSSANSGGGGGGGGSVVTDHNLLTNLTYATSGHVGFTPSPHDNTHHSQPFILSTDVTYANLNANGSVGTGAVQVSRGNHTHSEFTTLNSIPSGSKMLFYSDVAIVGWTIITAIDDSVVYITKGSAAGGVPGAAYKPGSTWSQPLHAHSVATHVHDMAGHYHGFTLPAHAHTYSGSTSYEIGVGANRATGGDNSHYHTYSGTTDASSAIGGNTGGPSSTYTGVGGPSITGDNATSSGWRPYGFTFTLQQRI
jgi:hypothetical protein